MQEDFLHYIWKFQKFSKLSLKTESGEDVVIIRQGDHNHNSGPDFFNSQIRINDQLWAGNVEIHLRSGDWYAHNHETDVAYDNVILHVVWNHDCDVYRKDNSIIPTLRLQERVNPNTLRSYNKLFSTKQKWIHCEEDFPQVEGFLIQNWMERLYFERLENKSEMVSGLLANTKNDWEAVLFQLLAKNFGLKVNGDSFLSIANSLDFSLIRKVSGNREDMEALLLGQAGFLDTCTDDEYFLKLQDKYLYLKTKFRLKNEGVIPSHFFRLRPANFPTIRLVQLAAVYAAEPQLFSKLMQAKTRKEISNLFDVVTSPFWDTHYHFTSHSASRKKKITPTFVDLLIINTVALIKFCYAKEQGRDNSEEIISLLASIPKEENSIVQKFNSLQHISENALHSQALLQLKNEYCTKHRCLQCAVGSFLIEHG